MQELRERVEAERQANVEACKKARELELLLKTERQSFQEELAEAKAAVRVPSSILGSSPPELEVVSATQYGYSNEPILCSAGV